MSRIEQKCHGQFETLVCSSASLSCPTRVYKFLWHIKNSGVREALATVKLRTRRFVTSGPKPSSPSQKGVPDRADVLDLQPGEWVRVRSRDEIRARLDSCEREGGLAWMSTMEGCCEKEFRVYKRVEKIVLESTGEIRRLRNTVLLEDAICDGIYGCDRSCFFFWKEAWLERVSRHR